MLWNKIIGAGGYKPPQPTTITSITSIGYAVGSGDTITLPSDINAGDLLIATASAGSASASSSSYPAYPTIVERYLDGFTGIDFDQKFYQYRTSSYVSAVQGRTIQYKVADQNDANSSISGFIYRSSLVWQGVVLFVIRGDLPFNGVDSYSFSHYGTSGDPPQYSINSNLTTNITIPIFCAAGRDLLPTVSTSPAPDKIETASPDYHGFAYSGVWASYANSTYAFNANDTGPYNAGTYGTLNVR